ncbi:hypothetical protein TcCL_Unassigned03192, partial [Trypanosoma cruzi]
MPPAVKATAGASLFVTLQQTQQRPSKKHKQREAKGHSRTSQHPCAVASRIAVVSTAHPHITPHAGKSPVNGYTAAVPRRQVQLLEANQSAIVPGTRNATPLTDCTPTTSTS